MGGFSPKLVRLKNLTNEFVSLGSSGFQNKRRFSACLQADLWKDSQIHERKLYFGPDGGP